MYESAERVDLNGKARNINKTAARAANRIQDDAEDAMSTVFGAVNAVKEDLEDLAQSAGKRVRSAIDSAESNVTEWGGNMTAAVRENPIQSSLIALGVGAVIGMLLRR